MGIEEVQKLKNESEQLQWTCIEHLSKIPEGMVQTFTHEEPSSFETLESEIGPSWEQIKTFVIFSVLFHSLLIPS